MDFLLMRWTFLFYEPLERAVPEGHLGEFLELEQGSSNTGAEKSPSLLLTLDERSCQPAVTEHRMSPGRDPEVYFVLLIYSWKKLRPLEVGTCVGLCTENWR